MLNIKKIIILSIICLLHSVNLISEEIQIPIMVGQTGASSSFGTQEMKGYTLATEEWNAKGGIKGKKINLLIEDTQTNQKSIVSAFHRLALKNPNFILGPTWLDGFPAIIPLAKKKDIALITPSAAVEALGKYTGWPISFYYNTTIEIKELLAHLKKSKLDDRIAIIHEEEPYADLVHNILQKESINIVESISIQTKESDFKSSLVKLTTKKPSTLIILVWNELSLSSLLKQLREIAPNIKLASIHDAEAWIEHQVFSKYIQQIVYTKFILSNKNFLDRYIKRFQEKPSLTGSNAYDAANNVFIALSSGAKTGSEIHNYLKTNTLSTATFGDVKLNSSNGMATSKVKVINFIKK